MHRPNSQNITAEHILVERKKFNGDSNAFSNIFRKVSYDSAMCEYFWNPFIEVPVKTRWQQTWK